MNAYTLYGCLSNVCAFVINQLSLSDPILQNLLFFRVCQLQLLYLVTSIHKALLLQLQIALAMQTETAYQVEHARDIVITVFQVKLLTAESKPTVSSTDISTTKNLEKLKCQEIVSSITKISVLRVHSSTTEFILSCFQSVS